MTKSGSENGITTYEYDLNNRLTKEANADNAGIHTTQYTCDHNGNQVLKYYWNLTNSTGSTPSVFLQPGGGLDTFVYDGLNRLIAVEVGGVQAEYTYKTDGLRISKTVDGVTTRHIWDGANISAETDDSGAVIAVYLRGVNLIASETGGVSAYYLFNAHGDVVQLADSNGVVVKTYKYDAFGVEWNPSSSDANPFRYCGEYWDGETGNYYLMARYYDPSIGRFITADTHWNVGNMIYGDNPQDPLGLGVYVPSLVAIWQSGNLYIYGLNNPVMYIDPSGKLAWFVAPLIGAVIGGVVSGTAQVISNVASGNAWNQGLLKAMGTGAVVGALSAIPIPGLGGVLRVAITGIQGGIVNTAGDLIKGDINNLGDVFRAFGIGAGASLLGVLTVKGVLGIANKWWAGLNRTQQKQAITGLMGVNQSHVNIVYQMMKQGVTQNVYNDLVKQYGIDVMFATLVSMMATETAGAAVK